MAVIPLVKRSIPSGLVTVEAIDWIIPEVITLLGEVNTFPCQLRQNIASAVVRFTTTRKARVRVRVRVGIG